MTNQSQNDNADISSTAQAEWLIDISDWSLTINHRLTGIIFRFERDSDLASVDDVTANEDHPRFQDLFDEATQIAQDIATEEWAS